MNTKIDPHTLRRAEERGTTAEEIIDVIETGMALDAKSQRLAKSKVYAFNQQRLGKFYEQKRVEVIYTIEDGTYITVTVYVFYGKWEANE